MPDDLLRHLGEKNHPYVCPALIHVGNDVFHAGVLDGEVVRAVLGVPQRFDKGIVRKRIPLAGNIKVCRRCGAAIFFIKLLDPLLLLQQGNGVAQKFPPLRRELHTSVAAGEKLNPQFLLQLPHSRGNTGLGKKQLVGGLIDGSALGDLHHISQLLESHEIIS